MPDSGLVGAQENLRPHSVSCLIAITLHALNITLCFRKLYRNDSYLDILSGDIPLSSRSSAAIENRFLNNNARSLKPLRKPNFPKGPHGEILAVDHEAPVLLQDERKKPEAATSSSEKAPNITISTDSEKRMAKMSIDDIPERSVINGQIPAESDQEKPQPLSMLKLEIVQNHLANHKKMMDRVGAIASASKQRETWMLHFPLEKADGEMFGVVVQCVPVDHPKRCWVILADHETQCDKLLRDINGQVNPEGKPVRYDDILVDDIYTAPYEGFYYRVVILEKVCIVRVAGTNYRGSTSLGHLA